MKYKDIDCIDLIQNSGHCMVNKKLRELKMKNIAETTEIGYTGWQLEPKENIQNQSYDGTDCKEGKTQLLLPSSIRYMTTCG
jgi:hypothetical protein